jgi:hypothetical protein
MRLPLYDSKFRVNIYNTRLSHIQFKSRRRLGRRSHGDPPFGGLENAARISGFVQSVPLSKFYQRCNLNLRTGKRKAGKLRPITDHEDTERE